MKSFPLRVFVQQELRRSEAGRNTPNGPAFRNSAIAADSGPRVSEANHGERNSKPTVPSPPPDDGSAKRTL